MVSIIEHYTVLKNQIIKGRYMKLYIDTASPDIIKEYLSLGIIDGITTNPTNLSSLKGNPSAHIRELLSLLPNKDVSIEVTEIEPEKVYKQAIDIANLSSNVLVKIPCSPQYYSVINRLVKEGISLNITLVFSFMQGLMMAKLGVTYISPFVGRLQDIGHDGVFLIDDLTRVIKGYNFKTKILAASLRNLDQVQDVVRLGTDAITIPPSLLKSMLHHPLTTKGIETFEKNWQELGINKFP